MEVQRGHHSVCRRRRALSLLYEIGGIPRQNLLLILVAFSGMAGFLYWRKNADRKAVAKQVETMV
ncbi:hypothetical protein [Sinorhizobium medicae]